MLLLDLHSVSCSRKNQTKRRPPSLMTWWSKRLTELSQWCLYAELSNNLNITGCGDPQREGLVVEISSLKTFVLIHSLLSCSSSLGSAVSLFLPVLGTVCPASPRDPLKQLCCSIPPQQESIPWGCTPEATVGPGCREIFCFISSGTFSLSVSLQGQQPELLPACFVGTPLVSN